MAQSKEPFGGFIENFVFLILSLHDVNSGQHVHRRGGGGEGPGHVRQAAAGPQEHRGPAEQTGRVQL